MTKVLYFAWLRSRVGHGEESLDLPPSVDTVGALVEHLRGLSDGHAEAFADMSAIRCAVNQDFAQLSATIEPGDEVAFFPPVTGG